MIYFKPVYLDEAQTKIKFEAYEDDKLSGSCFLAIEDSRATVENFDFQEEKPYIIEGLIKSAFNFATIKNCYMGYCRGENVTAFLDRMNFINENGVYFNDIPTILQGNCCKKQ